MNESQSQHNENNVKLTGINIMIGGKPVTLGIAEAKMLRDLLLSTVGYPNESWVNNTLGRTRHALNPLTDVIGIGTTDNTGDGASKKGSWVPAPISPPGSITYSCDDNTT